MADLRHRRPCRVSFWAATQWPSHRWLSLRPLGRMLHLLRPPTPIIKWLIGEGIAPRPHNG